MPIPSVHCEARKVSACQKCGAKLRRRSNESYLKFIARRYCSRQCSGLAQRPAFTWQKFDSLVDKADGDCWAWLGRVDRGGYARIWKDGHNQFVHRLAYFRATGIDPGKLDVLHRCDNPRCVNPAHLWLGTQTDNNHDMWNKNRARVPLGQEHGNVKLTDAAVRDIRSSEVSNTRLAKRYGVTRQLIGLVRSGQLWKHVQ